MSKMDLRDVEKGDVLTFRCGGNVTVQLVTMVDDPMHPSTPCKFKSRASTSSATRAGTTPSMAAMAMRRVRRAKPLSTF